MIRGLPFWQREDKFCSHAFGAHYIDIFVVRLDDFLYNGKTKSGASGLLGTALIYTVETFKDALLALLWNTDAGILHGQQYMLSVHPDVHADTSARFVVADRIVAQIVEQFLEHILIAIYGTVRALARDFNVMFCRIQL